MDPERGKVSVWVNKVPPSDYPASYFVEQFERDAPLCKWAGSFGFNWYDHDFMDVARTDGAPQPIRELLKDCSYVSAFLERVAEAAGKAGRDNVNHAILLYDFDYAARDERIAEDEYMRFLGTFEYDASGDDDDAVTEAKILAVLTNDGMSALELSIVLKDDLLTYNPETIGFLKHMIDDDELAQACKGFLMSRGARFDDWQKVLEWAIAHSWPRVGKLAEVLVSSGEIAPK